MSRWTCRSNNKSKLTQEQFAGGYHIPLGTLRDWEQGGAQPDRPTQAYLKIIACEPDRVGRLLNLGIPNPNSA